MKTVIKKRHHQIDTKLNVEYFRVKKDLKDINAKTESNNGLKTINLYNNTSSLSTISTNSNTTQPVIATRSFTSTPIDKVFTNKKEPSQNLCKYIRDNCFSKDYNVAVDDSESLNSRSVTSNCSLTSSSCSLYPCALLQSYTSLVGPKNDRKVKTAPAMLDSRSSFKSNGSNISSNEVEIECFAKSEYELSQMSMN
jgi:hypothetical protein